MSRFLSIVSVLLLAACGGGGGTPSTGSNPPSPFNASVYVHDPQSLHSELPAQFVPVGEPGDYKPDMALLPNGELLLTMFQPQHNADGTYQENIILYASSDGGQTWGNRRVLPLLGREPYLTVLSDGTVFMTVQILTADYRNTVGYNYSAIYRSADGGQTWDATSVMLASIPGATAQWGTYVSRTVLQQANGSLLLGVSSGPVSYVWRSSDEGLTWQQTAAATPDVFQDRTHKFFDELVFYEPPDGSILGIGRVGACELLPPFPNTQCPSSSAGDVTDQLVVYRSTDGGISWTLESSLGDYYGEMYPAVLKLPSNQLLFTFTVRALQSWLGVEVATGTLTQSGFEIDFATDRIMTTPDYASNNDTGGGFGNTLGLPDGKTFVTAYSYVGTDNNFHAQTTRWQLQ